MQGYLLTRVGFSEEIATIVIQDDHLRVMEIPAFQNQTRAEQQSFATQLNITMFSLVGANERTGEFHERIAGIALDLRAKVYAYAGIFENTIGVTGQRFDPILHELEHCWEQDAPEVARKRVLTTITFGVSYKSGGKEWRVCAPARCCWITVYPLRVPMKSAMEKDHGNSTVHQVYCQEIFTLCGQILGLEEVQFLLDVGQSFGAP